MTSHQHLSEYNKAHNAEKNALRSRAREQIFGYCERYAKLAIMRAFGMKRSEMSMILGISENTIDQNFTENGAWIDPLEAFIRAQLAQQQPASLDDVESVDPEKYTEHAQKRLGLMLKVIDDALRSNKIKIAMGAAKEMHKVLGFTTRVTHEHGGRIGIDVKVLPSPDFLKRLRTVGQPELPPAEENP